MIFKGIKIRDIRAAVKAIDEDATASVRDGVVIVKAPYKYTEIKAALPALGLEVEYEDIEGSRWNWVHRMECRAVVR